MNFFINTIFTLFSLSSVAHLISVGIWGFIKHILDYKYVSKAAWEDPLNAWLTDLGLVILFFIQHKLMRILNELVENTFVEPLFRSIYILATSLVLQTIVKYWSPISYRVWDFSFGIKELSSQSSVIYWVNHLLPYTFLAILFVQILLLDLPLIVGVKQTYYHLMGRGDPLNHKSAGMRRYIGNFHHPVLALLLILWLRPCMSVDRFILACGLSVIATQMKPDYRDVAYVKMQTRLKIYN